MEVARHGGEVGAANRAPNERPSEAAVVEEAAVLHPLPFEMDVEIVRGRRRGRVACGAPRLQALNDGECSVIRRRRLPQPRR